MVGMGMFAVQLFQLFGMFELFLKQNWEVGAKKSVKKEKQSL